MDLKTYIDNAVKASRQETLAQSDQLTVGELIIKLEPIVARQKEIIEKYKREATVVYDFEYLFPTHLMSWRGSYRELALNFVCKETEQDKPMPVSSFLRMIKNAIGQSYEGYKGGDFIMGKTTPIWVANYGNGGHTAIIDVVDNDYEVILITGLREY